MGVKRWKVFSFLLIGHWNYNGLGFATRNWKALEKNKCNLRLISNCALAGGPSPRELVPVQEYHPASAWVTEAFVKVVVTQALQLSPGMSTPLNCHFCERVGGLPMVLQEKVASCPSDSARFFGWSASDWTTGRSEDLKKHHWNSISKVNWWNSLIHKEKCQGYLISYISDPN